MMRNYVCGNFFLQMLFYKEKWPRISANQYPLCFGWTRLVDIYEHFLLLIVCVCFILVWLNIFIAMNVVFSLGCGIVYNLRTLLNLVFTSDCQSCSWVSLPSYYCNRKCETQDFTTIQMFMNLSCITVCESVIICVQIVSPDTVTV